MGETRVSRVLILLVLCLVVGAIVPSPGQAYSYGNPNEEKIAEAYKKVVAALNEKPPNWAVARSEIEAQAAEMAKEFGQETVDTLLRLVDNQQADAVVHEFQVVLVRNVERRLTNLEAVFDNYGQAKLLLAKAYATYEALSPIVQRQDAEKDKLLRAQFEQALTALGNPGLFGVGKKEPNPEQYAKAKATILRELKAIFKTDAAYSGHAQGSDGSSSLASQSVVKESSRWGIVAAIVAVAAGVVGLLLWLSRRT